jgi:beta-lactamase regulating signal transducer with metallopeptidase domain
MMFSIPSLLDHAWRILAFSTAVSTVVYILALTLHLKIFRISPVYLRNTWRFFYLQIFAAVAGSAVYLTLNREAAVCFESFLKSSSSPVLTRTLAAAWMAGFAVSAFMALRSFIRNHTVFKTWTSAGQDQLIGEISALYGKRNISVILNPLRESPFVFGISKPVLVLPESFSQSVTPETFKSVIAHELAHVDSNDNFWNLMALVLTKIFFFNPLIYIGNMFYTDVQEKAADLRAIQVLNFSKSKFAESFFEMISFCNSEKHLISPLLSTFGFRSLKSRLGFLAEANDPKRISGLVYILIAGTISLTWSVVEARSSLAGEAGNGSNLNMCVQVQHERTLEKIFQVKAKDPVRCE